MTLLETPEYDPDEIVFWVDEYLGHLMGGEAGASGLTGGQREADRRLAALDIAGYAANRNEVLPRERRGATQLSPWIRHGLLTLREVWDAVDDAPARDRSKYRDELLWQEYARHWYARLGGRTRRGVRNELPGEPDHLWDTGMLCLETVRLELYRSGWLVNQTRMWLASHWAIRQGNDWRTGEDEFFRHLLDGSRAANRLGWQWTTGVGSSKPYGFSRWQVEKRAPDLCRRCDARNHCPIQDWPEDRTYEPVDRPLELKRSIDLEREAGPEFVETHRRPDAVWLTAESLGDNDPALASNPDLPAIFVFDEPLLRRLELSAKRLAFLAECLADLAERRTVEVHCGDPVEVLRDRDVAVTFAPVPGYRSRAAAIDPAEVHPWPWLIRPTGGAVQSFSAWRKTTRH